MPLPRKVDKAPTAAQVAWGAPELYDHFPLTSHPPDTRQPTPVGAATPVTRASGSAPKTSSWALSGKRPASQLVTEMIIAIHAVEPSASPRASETSDRVRRSVSYPPKRLGVSSRKTPASASLSTTSAETTRSAAPRSACARRSAAEHGPAQQDPLWLLLPDPASSLRFRTHCWCSGPSPRALFRAGDSVGCPGSGEGAARDLREESGEFFRYGQEG